MILLFDHRPSNKLLAPTEHIMTHKLRLLIVIFIAYMISSVKSECCVVEDLYFDCWLQAPFF